MRKIIQVSTRSDVGLTDGNETELTVALCDDGTLWELSRWYDRESKTCKSEWHELTPIPQEQYQ